jgi:hypothetical protein
MKQRIENKVTARAAALIAAELHIQNELITAKTSREELEKTLLTGFALGRLANCFEQYIIGEKDIPDEKYEKREWANGPIVWKHNQLLGLLLADEDPPSQD